MPHGAATAAPHRRRLWETLSKREWDELAAVMHKLIQLDLPRQFAAELESRDKDGDGMCTLEDLQAVLSLLAPGLIGGREMGLLVAR